MPLASATIMVYSTRYDKSPDRQISNRTDRPSPDLFVPGRDFRHRSGLQQYRGMVVVDPRGEPAPQGSAVLSSARREFGIRIRRLRLRAKFVPRRSRRADPALASRRDFRQGQIGRLSPAQPIAELAFARLVLAKLVLAKLVLARLVSRTRCGVLHAAPQNRDP